MKEIWKDIRDFEGLYQVSNLGRVRRVGKGQGTKCSILRHKTNLAYDGVSLHRNNQPFNKNIHRLVAETFVPNPENKTQVNHKDGNKKNNRVDNLEWVTSKENARHSVNVLKNNPGDWSRKAVKCVETGEVFESQILAAKAYNTSQGAIGNAARGNRPRAGGHRWEFV